MSKIFVIAGTREQANQWIKSNLEKRSKSGVTTLSWSDYVIVNDPVKVRGYSDPHGVFIGTWRDRPDIEEIVEHLFMSSIHINRDLERIRQEVRLKSKKPTPKLKQVSGGWINEEMIISSAAKQLANEIDQQVINQLSMQTVSHEQLIPSMIRAIQDLKKELEGLKNGNAPTP